MSENETKAAWTPGPWTYESIGGKVNQWLVSDAGRSLIATVAGYSTPNENNARLIAAAPELVEALKQAVRGLQTATRIAGDADNEADFDAVIDAARKALAKAEGREG